MRTQPDDTVAHTAKESGSRAPCPSCGGTRYHPSNIHMKPCGPCGGTGLVQSAARAHEIASGHMREIAELLSIAVDGELSASAIGALQYAAEHLTIQAAVMVNEAPHSVTDDAPPADRILDQSMLRAGGDIPSLHAVLSLIGDREDYALRGAMLIAQGIAVRMEQAEGEIAKLNTEAPAGGLER